MKGGNVVVRCEAMEGVDAITQAEESDGEVDRCRMDWMATELFAGFLLL